MTSTPLDPSTLLCLTDLKRRGVSLGLDRMREFLGALGNPHERVPVVHIAGTNGKGSVAAMIEAALRASGWKTGLYTSPHLVRLGERIQVGRVPLANETLAAYVAELRPLLESCRDRRGSDAVPSYFEFMTALAFVHFARERCDVAVVEAGMGGRLDATNVVMPEVSVITSIGLDHCGFLGGTIPEIATEKAGIIKPGRPVVFGPVPREAEDVIRSTARLRGSPALSVTEVFGPEVRAYPDTNLAGDHQRANAATAMLAARQLSPAWLPDEFVVTRALMAVDWPGRWQRLTVGGRTVVIDASHNAEGANVLDRCLAGLSAEWGRAPVVILGVLGAARAAPLLEAVSRHAREIHLVMPRQQRACTFAELEALVPADFNGRVLCSTVEKAFPSPGVCSAGTSEPVVVTGSIYLAGEVLARIEPARGPLEHDLQDF